MKIRNLLLLFIFTCSLNFAQSKPYVLLISFDGFRWDYLDRDLSPTLDKFKSEGVRALSLRPSYPSKTFPNHLSIITGMYPENHGIITNYIKDPYKNRIYRLGSEAAVTDPSWYLGEPFWVTAERNGIITASYFWPGSEMKPDYLHPTYFKKFDQKRPYKERIDGVADWLSLPYKERPHFVTLYFSETDNTGHKFGPNSNEVNNSIKLLDSLTEYLIDKLNGTPVKDSVNIIIVSDHGMTEISPNRIINIDSILNENEYDFQNYGPFMLLEPINKTTVKKLYIKLKMNENHFKVYRKNNVPANFHFSHNPFITPIVVMADLGWSLVNNKLLKKLKGNYSKGDHGYDNNQMDMHGLFLAKGPNFKKNYYCGTIWNIDIYPLLCKIFNISPRSNIDGKLERIEFLLK